MVDVWNVKDTKWDKLPKDLNELRHKDRRAVIKEMKALKPDEFEIKLRPPIVPRPHDVELINSIDFHEDENGWFHFKKKIDKSRQP